jgi:D-alanine-D-alanine ligase-like ATP-grasp enzyme
MDNIFTALEKKGFSKEYYSDGPLTFLTKGKKTLLFTAGFSPLVPYTIGLILSNKSFVRVILSDAKIPVPVGKTFAPNESHEAMVYVQKLGFPVILKQENSQRNIRSVVANGDLTAFRAKFAGLGSFGECIIIERMVTGPVYRVFYEANGFMQVLHRTEGVVGPSYISAYDNDFPRTVKTTTVYEDVTAEFTNAFRPLAKRVLNSFPPMKYISFEVIKSKSNKWCVLEVFHSPNPHLGYTAVFGNKKRSVLNCIVGLLMKKAV